MVDADEGWDVPVEFLAEPFSETTASPIPAWAGRRLNLYRLAGALGGVNPEPLATGVCGLRAGVVDADVAFEMGQPRNLPRDKRLGTSVSHGSCAGGVVAELTGLDAPVSYGK